jgi:hypothetical protein
MSGEYLNTRFYTSGICYYENKFLLLKINKSYKICPGDWEWLTCKIEFDPNQVDKSSERKLRNHILESLTFHTGLGGKIIRIYPAHQWFDVEFNLTYILYPILIKIKAQKPVIQLNNEKFSEYKWVNWDDILSFDRNNYLYDYLAHLKRYGIKKDIWRG